jgi:midasin
VLDCGLHLKKAIGSASFDFSTVKAVSQWLVEALEGCPSLFIGLHDRANLLRNLVSPSTGLGLSDIWSALYIERLSENSHESVKRIESLSRSLKASPTSSSTSFYFELIKSLTVYRSSLSSI